MSSTTPTIALVYDHLVTKYGGAEEVIQALHTAFPNAPLYTSVYNSAQATFTRNYSVRTTFLQHIPFAKQAHRLVSFAIPLAFETVDLDDFNIIISISSSYAKGVITKPQQLHICYLLTPTRFLFSHKEEYLNAYPILKLPGIQWLSRRCMQYLTWWDTVAAYRPDNIVPISKLVANRTKQFYNRESEPVIYPPVKITPISEKSVTKKRYFLCVSRFVPYKRLDLAIEACLELDQPLIIAGDGPDKQKLTHIHPYTYIRQEGESVEDFLEACFSLHKQAICFVGHVSAIEKQILMTNAIALLMPGQEDFGITALEAASLGVPSVIHAESGVAEILPPEAVALVSESVDSIIAGMKKVMTKQIDKNKTRKYTQQFSTEHFVENFREYVTQKWNLFSNQDLQ